MKKINKKSNIKSKSLNKFKIANYYKEPSKEDDNININKIKKFDNHKLNCLLDDLIKKDSEYDLIIQGYKEKINTKKRENNYLTKNIQDITKENNDMNNKNKKLNFKKDYKIKEEKIEFDYKNKIKNLNEISLKEKYNQEIKKNQEINNQIIRIKQKINEYKNKLKELETILNNKNNIIEKEEENMKKFLNEL